MSSIQFSDPGNIGEDPSVRNSIQETMMDLFVLKETLAGDSSTMEIKKEPEDEEELSIIPEPATKLKILKIKKNHMKHRKAITKKYKLLKTKDKRLRKNKNSKKGGKNLKPDGPNWEKNFSIRVHLKSLCFDSENLDSPKYLCQKCEYPIIFPNLVDFLIHTLKIHEKTLKFKCVVCSLFFEDTKQMNQHFSTHKINGIQICDEISAENSETENLDQNWENPVSVCPENFECEEVDEEVKDETSKKMSIVRFRYFNEDFKLKSVKNEKGSSRYQCMDCDAIYLRSLNCCTHVRNLHRPYLCEFCGKEKVGHKAYLAHKRLSHFYVKCPGCLEIFSNFGDFRKHSAAEHENRYLKCRQCEEVVDNHDLAKHNEVFHPPKRYNCSNCQYATSKSKQLLEKHILATHFKEDGEMADDEKRTYLCPHCAEIFEDHRKFNMHTFQKHGKKCPKCNRKFGKNYEQHVADCKAVDGFESSRFRPKKRKFELADDLSNQCPKCKTVFSCAETAGKHMDKFNGSCESYCDHCDRNFQDRKALQTHKRLTCPLTKKGYPCHICTMVLSRPLILKWHIDQHNKKPRFHCATCGTSFYDGNLYRVHSKKCTGPPNKPPYRPKPRDKIFRCSYCPAVFNQRLVLKQHFTDTHPGRNMMECYICGKRFKNVKRVLDHMNIHTGQKPYSCSYCPKTFAKESSVYLHHRTHEKETAGYSRKETVRKERAKKRPEIQPHFAPIYDFSFRI